MGGVGDTKILQSAFDTLPWFAVVQPGGQPVHGMSPEAFLYVPKGQLQSAFDTLPWFAVVIPRGHSVQGMSPEAFLYVPEGQGAQPKLTIANPCPALHEVFPTIQLSNEIMSASASLRLYTSTV